MKALPTEVGTGALLEALTDGWSLEVETAEYAPVGAGSYHWVVRSSVGARLFVTVDDLNHKSWLGDTAEAAFEGLAVSFDTAVALRGAGLDFVVAPIRACSGQSVRRLGPHHTVAVFPFMEGRAGQWGDANPAELAAVVRMLAELHRATPAVRSRVRRVGLTLPGRSHVEAALDQVGQPWSGGPYSERAREAVARRAEEVAELLALADRLAATVDRRGDEWVVTHGEPHAANVMRVGECRLLVDWDTVALAPPERDLWMVMNESDDELAAAYTTATGHRVDRDALEFYRLTWDLKDLAENLSVLRSPHGETPDTARAYDGLTYCVSIRDRWAAPLD